MGSGKDGSLSQIAQGAPGRFLKWVPLVTRINWKKTIYEKKGSTQNPAFCAGPYVQDRKTGEGTNLMQDAWQNAGGGGGGGGVVVGARDHEGGQGMMRGLGGIGELSVCHP